MTRAGRFILSIALLAAPACFATWAFAQVEHVNILPEPTFPDNAKLSLVTGHLATTRVLGAFACPDNHICLDSVWDDTFVGLKTMLGPPVDPSAHIRSVHDPELIRGPVWAYIVRPADDGQLWAIALRPVEHHRACFEPWVADEWPEFAAQAKRSGDEVCFRFE